MKWCVLLIVILVQHHFNEADRVLSRPKRVVGGYLSPVGLFPYVVSLRIYKSGVYMHFCGGAIISDRFILSSAHCMILQDNTQRNCTQARSVDQRIMEWEIIAVAGTNKLQNNDGKIYNIDSYMYHSEFSYKLGINDISLLKTSKQIIFNLYIQPIIIHNKEIVEGSKVIVPGWGQTSYPGNPSNNLKFIDLKTISYEECDKSWKKTYLSQICTYTQVGEGVCTSDSGGPLVFDGELVGLVSFGKPCGIGIPDVFTNVSNMNSWITSNMDCMNRYWYVRFRD